MNEATLSAADLAERCDVRVERVEELTALGLLVPADGGFTLADVGRLSVVEAVVGAGVAVEELARAANAGVVSLSWFGGVLPPVPALLDRTYAEFAHDLDIPFELVTRLFDLWGLVPPSPEAKVRDDDATVLVHAARANAALTQAGLSLEAGARYFGDNIRRIAESQVRFLQREMLEPMIAAGASLREVIEAVNPLVGEVVRPAVADLLPWLHRRHVEAINIQMLVQTLEAALAQAGVHVPTSVRHPAIAFLDLTGFTRLTDEAGDEEAVEMASTLSDLVRASAVRHGGTAVKLLGDGVMFHFPDPAGSIRCAIRLIPDAAERNLPPARVGVHAGPVVFRDCDYFGRTVNVAARITDYARPREVLVSDAVVDAATEAADLAFDAIGPVALKGVAEPVSLFSARLVAR